MVCGLVVPGLAPPGLIVTQMVATSTAHHPVVIRNPAREQMVGVCYNIMQPCYIDSPAVLAVAKMLWRLHAHR